MTPTRSRSPRLASLPRQYKLRAPSEGDLDAVTELFRSWEEAEFADADWTIQDTRDELASVDLITDAWLVVGPEDVPAGFVFLDRHRPHSWWGFGCVHPAHRGRGLGTTLLERYEERAQECTRALPAGAAVELQLGASGRDERGRALFERAGFRWKRRYWDMSIELDRAPDEPNWPSGIEVKTFDPSQARAVHEASNEAFRDHFDHTPRPFEDWRRRMLDRDGFDPSLWFVAWEGSEIAGLSLCKQRAVGWVDVLGVRRRWRRRGLGLALLRHSFAEFFDRGVRKVGLGVDSESLTGATVLYERAGMRVVREYDMFAKQLPRSGEEG